MILIYGKFVLYELWGLKNFEEVSKYVFIDWDGFFCEERWCCFIFGREYLFVSDVVLVYNNWGLYKWFLFEEILRIRLLM